MEQKNILLIEDNAAMRKILKLNLEKLGYFVKEAGQGEEAILKITFEFKPDLIITDLMMPVKDGYQFIDEFRKGFVELSHIPIIVLSAKGQKDDVLRAIKIGANDYLVKPFKREELISKIENYLKK